MKFVIIANNILSNIRIMGRSIIVLLIVAAFTLFSACRNNGVQDVSNSEVIENRVLQQDDGTISLKVEKAECYHDMGNPSTNTAEWNVVVSKSGRFNVWLSSSTKDTTNLKYNNKVMLSILDNRLEAHPKCDKIYLNSTDVSLPYFRADSFMGALYIQDTGLYNIQLISEKLVPKNYPNAETEGAYDSRLLSVFLTPITR
ncbi:MAG: hypothetical protein IPJ16_12815 [Bacteroidales bacterium]|nr:hypothetical protein [Bacteroidales bacterium]